MRQSPSAEPYGGLQSQANSEGRRIFHRQHGRRPTTARYFHHLLLRCPSIRLVPVPICNDTHHLGQSRRSKNVAEGGACARGGGAA